MTSKRRARRGRRDEIPLKSEEEIARMRRAGQVVALTLDRLTVAAVPGVTTRELDRIAEATIRSFGGDDVVLQAVWLSGSHLCLGQ